MMGAVGMRAAGMRAVLPLPRPRACACAARVALFSSAAAADGVGREAFGKLAGRAPKGARKRKPRRVPKPVSLPAEGSVSAVELRSLGKELGWDDEMIKNPDLLDILLVESARRQEDTARLKGTALYNALAGRFQAEFRVAKSLWNDTGAYGKSTSQFKPASAVRGPPPKSAKSLGAGFSDVPQEGEPITVDLGTGQTTGSSDSLGVKEHAVVGGGRP